MSGERRLAWALGVALVGTPLALGGALDGARAALVAAAFALPLATPRLRWRVDPAWVCAAALAGLAAGMALAALVGAPAAAVDPGRALDGALAIAALAIAGAAAAQIGSRRVATGLLVVLAASAALVAALGLAQQATWNGRILWFYAPREWIGDEAGALRASGPFVNPNHFASFLALGLFAALALAVARERASGRRRLALGASLALLPAAIVASASRSVSAAVALGVAVLVVLGRSRASDRPRLPRLPRRAATVAALGAIALAIVLLAGGGLDTLGDRWLGLVDAPASGGASAHGLPGRLDIWRATWALAGERPVTGVGPGGFELAVPAHLAPPAHVFHWRQAHSEPLQVAAESGALGLALLGAAAALGLCSALAREGAHHTLSRPVRVVLLVGLGTVAAVSLVEFPLRLPAPALATAVLAGLVLARRRPSTERELGTAAATARGVLCVAGAALSLSSVVPALAPIRAGLEPVERVTAAGWAEMPGLARGGPVSGEQRAAAERRFERAAALAPRSHEAHLGLALTAADPARALSELGIAIELHPTSAAYRDQRALLALAMGRRELALADVEEALYLAPELGAHVYSRADRIPRLDADLAAAVERGLRRAFDGWAHPADTGVELVGLLERRGRLAEAAALGVELVDRAVLPEERLVDAAGLLRRAGRDAAARELERRWIDGAPAPVRVVAAVDRSLLPVGRAEEALALVIAERERRGEGATLTRLEGRLRLALGDDRARATLERAVELAPHDARAHALLGVALAVSGDAPGARRSLERALSLGERGGLALLELGRAEERLGRPEEALRRYREARAAGVADERWLRKRIFRLEEHLAGRRALEPIERVAEPCRGLAGPCGAAST